MRLLFLSLVPLSIFAATFLEIEPKEALIDTEFSLTASGLEAETQIVIHSQLIDDEGTIWKAQKVLTTDELGNADLPDATALIWSMKPIGKSTLFRSNHDIKIEIRLEVDGETVASQKISRHKINPDIERISIRENGLIATLFLPPSKNRLPAVITLGGSDGGLNESRAELLASHGYATLALAYFGIEHLPSSLKNIPLEYCEKAIEWLMKRPEIDSDRIALWGISRGGELALILGSLFPEKIQAIAAYVPSSVVYGPPGEPNGSSWIYRGNPIAPNAPFNTSDWNVELGYSSETAIPLTPFFLKGIEEKQAFEAAAIPVEKIRCPLLIVSGQDDQMWPSWYYGQKIIDRLTLYNSSIPCDHLCYPGAGHFILPPYSPTTCNAEMHPAAKLWFDFGGNSEDNAFAQKDSWKKTLRFFEDYL